MRYFLINSQIQDISLLERIFLVQTNETKTNWEILWAGGGRTPRRVCKIFYYKDSEVKMLSSYNYIDARDPYTRFCEIAQGHVVFY